MTFIEFAQKQYDNKLPKWQTDILQGYYNYYLAHDKSFDGLSWARPYKLSAATILYAAIELILAYEKENKNV